MNRKSLPIAIVIAATSIAAPIAHADTPSNYPISAEKQAGFSDFRTIDLGKIFLPVQPDKSDQEWNLNVVPGQTNRATLMTDGFKDIYKSVYEISPDLSASDITTGWKIEVEDKNNDGIVAVTPPANAKKGDKATYVVNYKDRNGKQIVKGTVNFIALEDGVAPTNETIFVSPGGSSEVTLSGGNSYPTATKFSINNGASNIPSSWETTVSGNKFKVKAPSNAKQGDKGEVAIDLKDDAGKVIATSKFNVEVKGDVVSPEPSKPTTSNPSPSDTTSPSPSKPTTSNPEPSNPRPAPGDDSDSPVSSDSAVLVPSGKETVLNIMDAKKYPAAQGASSADIDQEKSDIPNGWTVELDKKTGELSVLPPNEVRPGDKNYANVIISYKNAKGEETGLHSLTIQMDLGNGTPVKDGRNSSGSKSKKDKDDSDSEVTPTVISPSGTVTDDSSENGGIQEDVNNGYTAPGVTSQASQIGPEVKTGGIVENASFFAKVANLFR